MDKARQIIAKIASGESGELKNNLTLAPFTSLYAARAYREKLLMHGLRPSMSRRGNCSTTR